ncbi:MAG: hypothetical protein IJD78_04220 [Clostridia bacterium]|nr:hypothetical protein [Clostridia bacterium]
MISMDADAASVKKEIAAVERSIKKLENKQLPLITEFEKLRDEAAKAKQAIQEADKALASGKIDKVDHFMITDEATKNITTYNTKIEELRDKIEGLDNQIMPLKSSLESLKFTGSPDNSLDTVGVQAKANLEQAANAAGNMSKELSKAKSKSDELGKSVGKVDSEAGQAATGMKSKMTGSLKSVEGSFKNFGKRIGNTIKSAFVFSVIYKGLTELRQYLGTMLSTNQQFTSSLNQVKSNLAVAFQPIYQAVLPALITLVNWLVKATAFLASFTSALFGVSLSSSIDGAREMQNAVNAVENGASGASAAERELTAAIKEKQKQVKALQKENKRLQREYEQQKKAVEAQTEVIEKQISSLEKSIDSIQKMEDAANKAAQAQREAIQKSIDLLNEQQEAIQKRSQAEQKAIDSQVKSLQKQQKALQKEYKNRNKAFDSQLKALQKQQKALQKEYDSQIDAFDEQIKNIKAQQDRLSEEYDIQTKGIDTQIDALKEEIQTLQKAQKVAEEAKTANEKFTASFDDLSTLGSVEEKDPYEEEIEKKEEEIELLQKEKDAQAEVYEARNEELEKQIGLIESQKEAITEAYEAEVEAIQAQTEAIQEQKEAYAEAYENRTEKIQERIDKLQEEKEAIAEKYDLQNEKIQEQIDLLQEQQDKIRDADYSSSIDRYESRIASLREKIDELNASVEENPLIEQNELLIEQLQDEIDLLQEQKSELEAAAGAASNTGLKIQEMGEDSENASNKGKTLGEKLKEAFNGAKEEIELAKLAIKNKFAEWEKSLNSWCENLEIKVAGAFAWINKKSGETKQALIDFTDNLERKTYEMVNIGISAAEGLVNAIIRGINWCAEKINDVFSFEIPEWIPKYGGQSFSANLGKVSEISLPRIPVPALASGAVLPPNKPFMAWVGDQKNGTNVEAPLSTIEDALRNVMAEQEFNFNFTADGSLGAFIRMLNLQINRENTRKTAF